MMDLTDVDRRRLVTEWQASGLDQTTFARSHRIAPRTLRSWQEKFCRERQPVDQSLPASEPLAAAFEAFGARLTALESAVDVVRAAVAQCQAAVDGTAACRPPASSCKGTAVEAHDDEHQPAGGMPMAEPVEVAPAVDTEYAHALDDAAAVQQAVAAAEQGAAPGEPGGGHNPEAVRPLAFPRGWERGGGLLTF